jgi:hypothetical protein
MREGMSQPGQQLNCHWWVVVDPVDPSLPVQLTSGSQVVDPVDPSLPVQLTSGRQVVDPVDPSLPVQLTSTATGELDRDDIFSLL